MFPLALVKSGIKVILELARHEFALVSASSTDQTAGAGYVGASYTISNPRFVCSLVQPSEQVMSSYVKQFENSGISYTFPYYKHFRNVVNAGESGSS